LKTVSGLADLLQTHRGEITFLGQRIDKKPAHAIARMGMAHVPEGRRVFPASSVEENLVLGGYTQRRAKVAAADLADVYARFPILAERRNQPAGYLSGGEQQMLAIGRGLMARPRFLLLDEPSLGLAPLLVEQIFEIIKGLAQSGMTILLVEQMANMALAVAHRAYVLETGEITTSGPAAQVAADPKVRAAYLGA
jgi:branched-chain amino acid transport system ATP-binding protein